MATEDAGGTDVVNALRWRYATKEFDQERKIDPATWAQLESSLILSPSSFGLQPWKFVVVTDQEIKEKLVDASWHQRQPADCSHLVVICRLNEMTADYIERYVEYAAGVRNVLPKALESLRGMMLEFAENLTDEELAVWMSEQCYIALGTLLTSAAVLGVDACPMEGFVRARYDYILGLKEKGCRSVVLCALGYRAGTDKYAHVTKVRFLAEQVLVRI